MQEENKREAKFFCENCGSPVSKDARACGVCGKFFVSVRCPKCGKVGTTRTFINGCPVCGYAVNKKSKDSSAPSSTVSKKTPKRLKLSIPNLALSLPLWVYLVTFFLFAATLFIVYNCVTRG